MTNPPKVGDSCRYRSIAGDIWPARVLAIRESSLDIEVMDSKNSPAIELHFVRWVNESDNLRSTAFPEK